MEKEYYRRYEPFFGEWRLGRFIGAGSYGKVFEIERRDALGTVSTSAMKALTIPSSQDELDAILASGMDEEGVSDYFQKYVDDIKKEIALMQRLKGHSTIVSYEDHRAYPHPDGRGWDILIRMELLRPINDDLRRQKIFTRAEVLRLGIDLCSALEVCQKNNIIHRDIKPGNIFLSQEGSFKLGDFGVARIASASMAASTRAGTVNYMAPEVFQGRRYTSSVDIYSLGLVLYQLLNMNRMPFYPPPPQNITPDQQEHARARRFSGEPLPPPAQADPALAAVVLKACAWDPAARYASPAQMRQALEALTAAPAPAREGPHPAETPVPQPVPAPKKAHGFHAPAKTLAPLPPRLAEAPPAEGPAPAPERDPGETVLLLRWQEKPRTPEGAPPAAGLRTSGLHPGGHRELHGPGGVPGQALHKQRGHLLAGAGALPAAEHEPDALLSTPAAEHHAGPAGARPRPAVLRRAPAAPGSGRPGPCGGGAQGLRLGPCGPLCEPCPDAAGAGSADCGTRPGPGGTAPRRDTGPTARSGPEKGPRLPRPGQNPCPAAAPACRGTPGGRARACPGKGPRRDGPSAALAGKAAHPGRRAPCRRAQNVSPADCAQKAAARPEAGPRRRQGAGRPAPTARSRRMAAVSPRPAINSGESPA